MSNLKSKYEFLKIPDEGGFICIKKHIFEEELCGTCFQIKKSGKSMLKRNF